MKMKVYMMIGLLLIFIACIGGEWIIDCIWNPPAKDTDASVPPEDKDSIHIQGEKQLPSENPKKADTKQVQAPTIQIPTPPVKDLPSREPELKNNAKRQDSNDHSLKHLNSKL